MYLDILFKISLANHIYIIIQITESLTMFFYCRTMPAAPGRTCPSAGLRLSFPPTKTCREPASPSYRSVTAPLLLASLYFRDDNVVIMNNQSPGHVRPIAKNINQTV